VRKTPIKYNATVLNAFEAGCGNVVCFLTEEISSIQLERLAALVDERKCESVSFF
jgi:hypothetical protein